MLDCPRCGRRVPEVLGAPEQVCPHCGAYIVGRGGAPSVREAAPAAPSAEPAPGAPAKPAKRVSRVREGQAVDAAGAVGAGFRAYRKHLGKLALFWLPVLALDLALSVGLLAWRSANGLLDQDVPADVKTGVRLLGVFLPPFIALWVLKLAYWGAAAPLVRGAVADGRVDLRAAFAAVKVRAGVLVPLAAALVILYLAGAILLLVPFLVFYYGSVATANAGALALYLAVSIPLAAPFFLFLHWYLFAPAAAMRDGETVAGALAASRAFAKERRTTGFMLAALAIVAAVYGLALAASRVAFDVALAVAPPWRAVAEEVGASVAAWLLAPLAACVVAAYWVMAERAPRAAAPAPFEAAPEEAPVVAALSGGGSRLRTTKCPGCAHVFSFLPNVDGTASRVECPSCGRTGLVR